MCGDAYDTVGSRHGVVGVDDDVAGRWQRQYAAGFTVFGRGDEVCGLAHGLVGGSYDGSVGELGSCVAAYDLVADGYEPSVDT